MVSTKVTAALMGAFYTTARGAVDSASSDEMGPAGFLWPPDREWSDKHDNTPPCGSDEPAGERTVFPLKNGKLALVAQDTTRAVHVSVSYENDPESMDDFETFFGPNDVGTLDLGHTCITVPDAPSDTSAGDNATFSILYVSNFEDDEADRTTHYACTDVTFVEVASFDESIPCFNATLSDPEPDFDESVDVTTTDKDGNSPHSASDFQDDEDEDEDSSSSSSSSSDSSDSSSSGGGLAAGTIAGAVVGSVAGASLAAAVAFFLVRRRKAKKEAEQDKNQMRQVDAEKASSDTLSTRS